MVLVDSPSRILQGMYSGFLRFPSPDEIWCSESGSGDFRINSGDCVVSCKKKLGLRHLRARDNIEILIRVVLGAPQCNDLRCELERSLAFVPAKCCILGHNASHYLARGLLLLQANRGNVGESEEKLESPSFLGSSKAILKRIMLLSLLSLSSSTTTTTGTMPKNGADAGEDDAINFFAFVIVNNNDDGGRRQERGGEGGGKENGSGQDEREDERRRRQRNNQPANEKEGKEVEARRMTADKRRQMMRGGGVGATTNRQTRDEGSKEEGEDGKATAM